MLVVDPTAYFRRMEIFIHEAEAVVTVVKPKNKKRKNTFKNRG